MAALSMYARDGSPISTFSQEGSFDAYRCTSKPVFLFVLLMYFNDGLILIAFTKAMCHCSKNKTGAEKELRKEAEKKKS